MRRSAGIAIAVAVGMAAIVLPIWVSLGLARRQSLSSEQSRGLSYARDVLRRSEETANQFSDAIRILNSDHLPPCSPSEIDLMRQIDLESSYIQAVGRVSGNSLICTSLDTKEPIPLPPSQIVTAVGVAERNNIELPIARSHPLGVLSQYGVAILIDPSLVVDTPTEGPGISIAIFAASSAHHNVIAERGGNLRPAWFKNLPKGTETSFIEDGYLVSVIRSAQYDLSVVAAIPERYANRGVRQFALIFVPIGLLCGAGLAWAVLFISRIQLSMPSMLRAAAKRGEFYLEYQPIVELESRRWIGAEALVRWRQRGRVVRPDQFIPVAEESGVITLITEQVMSIAATDLPKLVKLNPSFHVAINLSAPDLCSNHTFEMLQRALRISGAQPANIEIEATERSFLQGPEAREILAKIRSMGVTVAIDDFGTGYSSLACLQTLGLDTLKIDKAFVDTIGTDGATSQVVLHIIEMAHSLNLEMVAEGVETEEQAQFLLKRGVHYGQGWLFGRPMPIASLCESLELQEASDPARDSAVFQSAADL